MNKPPRSHYYPLPDNDRTPNLPPPCDTAAHYDTGNEPNQKYPSFPRKDASNVCPHCKEPTEIYLVTCDGYPFETHRCRTHGDIVPMLSHVKNPRPQP